MERKKSPSAVVAFAEPMDDVAQSFRALGDPVRLRLLRVFSRGEFGSGEAAQIVGIAPSTLSKHVATLREAGLVSERRDGRHAYYVVPSAARHDLRWESAIARVADAPDAAGDLVRLDEVLRARRESQPGGATARPFVPGRSWAAWSRALTLLVPRGLRVADLGCGDGALALEISRFAASVVGVDRRDALIRQARRRAAVRGGSNLRFEIGDFEHPALRKRAFDVVLFSQSLHATVDPCAAVRSAAGLLVPRGRILILDLLPHGESWVTERLGHSRLGFTPTELGEMLRAAGFREVRTERAAGRAGEPFKILLASAVLGAERKRAARPEPK